MKTQQVYSNGIYHGLPVHGDEHKDLTAVVTGANGISGQHLLRVLGQSPSRWSKIYSLSRRPPMGTELPANVTHISVDFLSKPEDIAAVLREAGVTKIDYVFFFSYIQVAPEPGKPLWSNAEAMCVKNTELLANFLSALSVASVIPRRVLLQTGAKNYGVHLGPAKVPQEESDARVLIEPNFYYPQEDYLWDWCKRTGAGWNVARPGPVLGAVQDAAINLMFPLAVYAAVSKHLGQPLEFPGDLSAWEKLQDQSSALMNGYLEEWAVLTPEAENQAFNATDGSHFTYGQFWPKLAAAFGIDWKGPSLDPSQYTVSKLSSETTPRGFGSQPEYRERFSIVGWAKRSDVQQAWREIASKHNLQPQELTDIDRVFSVLEYTLNSAIFCNMSMDKARRLGFFGTVNSCDSMLQVIQEYVDLKMMPPLQA
ncbi:NAD dependent epimerase/dehydratase family protein-like protein [Phyllosticta capitalensis]|uniref:NAD dependent epimerase/dehydratase family protein-like protein n=1 Tax=Phyllosticta capitalensis TaxID=121624 RepID=A0ABR1YED0_9PEZI